jgi:hypothetical protein
MIANISVKLLSTVVHDPGWATGYILLLLQFVDALLGVQAQTHRTSEK